MSTDWSDIGNEEWADRLKTSIEQARAASAARMELTDDLLESDQRIDEMEAEVEQIEDPVARDRQHAAVLQARLNNKLGETDHYLLEQVVQLQEAVVVLADRVRALQSGLRER
jgi:septal ring factor EnvC (AmiA/AmiB activator)